MVEVAALVSLGRHPLSGRARRAPLDARAVELGLDLAGPSVRLVHAGDPAAPALRDYLGMGVETLDVLAAPPEADAVAPLVQHLRMLGPAIVLCGGRAETGEGSGLVPYLVAHALDAALIPEVVDLRREGNEVRAIQALPRGRRRRVRASLPVVAILAGAAPAPRASAFARARRGAIVIHETGAPRDEARAAWQVTPARTRLKRLRTAAGGTALERLRAATEMTIGGGRVLEGLSAAAAASAIHAELEGLGLLARRRG